ncbi:FixH family protein [Azospirillum soli]|uniref:FixH family protein n=1 Tax=Azospirillum soli TaxID=1304799 RepID=UPI001FEA971A|nr:FixH family protein [Azospirillum soli]MBP2311727.1 nitrogen fixation protein FixH [Azospirillum soli]
MSTDAGNRRTQTTGNGRQPGWYIPWLFVAFFGVVVAVNAVMMHFAFSTWTGLQTEQHFIKGIKYNEDIAGARAQAERGWKVETEFTSTDPLKGLVALTLHDKYGNLLQGATVKVTFIRPTSQGNDVTMDLPYLGEGRYGAPVELALPGQWDLRVQIEHATGDYQDEKRIWIK